MAMKIRVVVALVTLAISVAAVPMANAAIQNHKGCPISASTQWAPGLTVSISWVIQGLAPVVAFQPTKIVLGGALAPLTPAQAQAYAPTLDNLRAAAQSRKMVTIYWDDATKVISTVAVHWEQPCP
jgi:hypothetical protein